MNISYKPAWSKYLALSIIVHILFIFLLGFALRKPVLDLKVKEVKVNLVSGYETAQQSSQNGEAFQKTSQAKISKPITREEVDKAIFEIVSPKKSISLPTTSESSPPGQGEGEIVPSMREFSEQKITSNSKEFGIKGGEGQSGVSKEVLKKSEGGVDNQINIQGSSSRGGGPVSGNIKWVKGEPRKVVEWYSPEIPPNIVKTKTEIVLTFFIESSGFVSKIEIEKTSGEPLIDEIIYKTMKRIRFSPAQNQTVATVSLTIIPQ